MISTRNYYDTVRIADFSSEKSNGKENILHTQGRIMLRNGFRRFITSIELVGDENSATLSDKLFLSIELGTSTSKDANKHPSQFHVKKGLKLKVKQLKKKGKFICITSFHPRLLFKIFGFYQL